MDNRKRSANGSTCQPNSKNQKTNESQTQINETVSTPTAFTANSTTKTTNISTITNEPSTSSASTAQNKNPLPSHSTYDPTKPTNSQQSLILSPKSFTEMTNPMPVNITTAKSEPIATGKPKLNIKEQNKRFKQRGLIKISLHGTEVYTNPELRCILNTLRARKAERIGPNLIQAVVLTGTYTHAAQIGNTNNLNELGPIIEQSTQVNGKEIDDEMYAKSTENWLPQKEIPELTVNQNIIPSENKPHDIKFNPRAFINYTNHAIPENVAVILSMGPKFAVPVYNTDEDFETLKDTAFMLNEMYGHPLYKAEVRSNICEYIYEYQNNQKKYRTENKDYFYTAIKDTKQFFKNHPNIIATQADKAKAAILLDKDVYINKVENLLRDTSTYQPLQTSSTRAYMKLNEKLLERMVDLKLISKERATRAVAEENQPANMYGLLKNHKIGIPIRPIVNTRNSMGYLAAEKATEILTRARDTGMRYNVLNSREACAKIRQTMILPDEILCSLDIVSMFTNITTGRAISSVQKRQKLYGIEDNAMNLIVDIIKFVCIQSTEIRFNDRIYKQIKGLRMGSSLSPILADFVVEDMLDNAFLTIERPKLLIKYVDDLLCVIEEKEAENMLHALNQCDPHIKFEMEKEQNQKLNYLDVTVYREGCELKTIWFQKHISSGLFLNYHSNHPRTTIHNTAIQYVVTMVLNTHPDHYDHIIETAKERLGRNSFPAKKIKEIIEEAKEKIVHKRMSTQTQGQVERDIFYTQGIDYIPKLTEKIQKEIIQSHNKQGEDGEMQIPAMPIHTMSKLVYNQHKNSNSQFNLEDHDTDMNIDLTQPTTSKKHN